MESPTILLTLGRLPKGLELARACHAAGARVIVADPFALHLCRASRAVHRCVRVRPPRSDPGGFLADLRRVVADEGVDLVQPVSEETLHVAALARDPPPGARVGCPPPETLLEYHDKLRFVRLAERLGLAVPESHAADTPAARELADAERTVVKPILGSAGHGVTILEPGDPLPPRDTPALVQRWLPGPELSSFSVAHGGRVIGTVVYRGLIHSTSVAVCFEALQEPPADVLAWVEGFVGATGHSGCIAFDFRLDEHGRAHAIECNPRTTSGVHFVEPADLARALLDPDRAAGLRLRPERRLQQFYPALTVAQADVLAGRGRWGERLPLLLGTRDVSFTDRDPLPFLLMPLLSAPILRRTMFLGESFGEAATADIGWYEGETPPAP